MNRYERKPGIVISLLLLVALLPACRDATGAEPDDVPGINALVGAWDAAWAAKDAAAYATLYAADVEYINPLGGLLAGREAVRSIHATLFSGLFAGSTQTTEIRRITFLTEKVAIVDLNVRLTGFRGVPPGLPQSEPGVVRTRVRWVVVKRTGTWEIVAQQITAVQPAP